MDEDTVDKNTVDEDAVNQTTVGQSARLCRNVDTVCGCLAASSAVPADWHQQIGQWRYQF